MRILRALCDALFRPSTQQNWPWDMKLTQSCRCLQWFFGADVWKILLQMYTGPVGTQVWIEKMFNKNMGFRVQFVTSVSERKCHYCAIIEAQTQWPLFMSWENQQSTSCNFNFLQYYVQFLSSTRCYEGVKIIKLLSFSNWIPFSFYLGHSGDRCLFFEKRPFTIAAMNAELPPFKNGDQNSESASTFDRDITLFIFNNRINWNQ